MATDTILAGYPDTTNTGVPAGTVLTPYNGDLVINTPGEVISGLNITGTVYINAPNVTLENCQITSGGNFCVSVADGITGTTVQNCTINGTGTCPAGEEAICGQGTFVGNNIYNCRVGINVTGSDTVIQNNYIHDLQSSGGTVAHYEDVLIDGGFNNVTVAHNTLEGRDTACVFICNDFGPMNNISVTNNLMFGHDAEGQNDAAYTIYVVAKSSNPGAITNVQVANNVMGTGTWGFASVENTSPVWTNNTDLATGQIISTNNSLSPAPAGSTAPAAPNAPTISSFSPDTGVVGDGITNANKLTIAGTADPNSTITVYDGLTKLGTATASSTGSWDYITAVLTNAKHVLTATETNSSGQTSAASAALAVTVDTRAPAAPVLVSDIVVNSNHIQLSGTAEANSTVTIYDGTTVVGTGTTSSTGAFSVTTSALSAGAHALTAKATDAAGNVSAGSQALDPVIGGSSTPTPPSTGPAAPRMASFSTDTGVVGDHITSDNTPTLSGTAVANSTVNVFDGTTKIGTATANANGQWSLTTKALSDGAHSLTATDTDSSGHTSAASAAFSVTVDTHAPNVPALAAYSQGGSAVGHTTAVNDLVLKGTAEANSTIHIFDGGRQIGVATTSGAGNWSFDTGHLANGAHSFTSTAVDVAGNASAASTPDAVTVTAPSTSAAKPIEFTNVSYTDWNHTATIQGTADAYSQVKLYDGPTLLGKTTASSNGTWSWTNSHLSDTLHTITAQELDRSGYLVGTSSGAAMLMGSHTSTLTGTGGDDFMYSSSSNMNDTFVFANNFGHSVIQGFTVSGPGQDTVQFSKAMFDSFASVLSHASQVGQDVVISSGNDTLKLLNTKLSALNSHDFHFA